MEYLRELNIKPIIFKNDEISIQDVKKIAFNAIIISPGAKNPDAAGISLDVMGEFYKTKRILGVCLGHQCIAQFFGAKIIKDENPFHGKTSVITVSQDSNLYHAIPKKFIVTRYHSLIVSTKDFPDSLIVTATTDDGLIMGIEHTKYPIYGVQYHPESILSQYGHEILRNFAHL